MAPITPRAAYTAAIQDDSPLGHRISDDELTKIRDAFNQRTFTVSVGRFNLGDSTRDTQSAFLRYLADENPALAQTLQRGGDWGMYFRLRNAQFNDAHETSKARREVLGSIDGTRPALTATDVPPALRQRISELGARARQSAQQVDPGNIKVFSGFLEGEWQSPEGRAIVADMTRLGFREPRQVAAEIIGRGR